MKCDVEFLETRDDGLSIYTFRYLGGLDPSDVDMNCETLDKILNDTDTSCEGPKYRGVIAQDLLKEQIHEHAIKRMCDDRYYSVDYDVLGGVVFGRVE